MAKRKRNTARQDADMRTVLIRTLAGSLVCAAVFFIFTAISSLICLKTDASDSVYKYLLIGAGAVSAMAGGFCAVRPIGKRALIFGAASALPAYLVIIIVCVLLSRSGLSSAGWILLAVMEAFGALGGMAAVSGR
ncbi:MAG: TIGR04086 family membrane protein [Clostridia bacterium]|nr:TIGR04086 family membrane protein [Clostridia bacterium]